jgi:hypothetical protein
MLSALGGRRSAAGWVAGRRAMGLAAAARRVAGSAAGDSQELDSIETS